MAHKNAGWPSRASLRPARTASIVTTVGIISNLKCNGPLARPSSSSAPRQNMSTIVSIAQFTERISSRHPCAVSKGASTRFAGLMSADGTKPTCPASRTMSAAEGRADLAKRCQNSAIDWVNPSANRSGLFLICRTADRRFDSEETLRISRSFLLGDQSTSPSAPPPEDCRPNCVKIQSYLAPGPTLRGVCSRARVEGLLDKRERSVRPT